jgi:hypothetical protein
LNRSGATSRCWPGKIVDGMEQEVKILKRELCKEFAKDLFVQPASGPAMAGHNGVTAGWVKIKISLRKSND